MLKLNQLKSASSISRKSKRVGRGNSSGKGNYSARGMKGQRSRSGGKSGLTRRSIKPVLFSLPKFKGVKSLQAGYFAVNLSLLNQFPNGTKITPKFLVSKGVVSDLSKKMKILADGKLIRKLTFSSDFVFSKPALEKIKKAGSEIQNKK